MYILEKKKLEFKMLIDTHLLEVARAVLIELPNPKSPKGRVTTQYN